MEDSAMCWYIMGQGRSGYSASCACEFELCVLYQGQYLEALDYMERSLVLRRCLYGNDR